MIYFLTVLFADAAASTLARLQDFEQTAELIFSILTKVFIIALVSIAIVYIIRVLLDKHYSIRHIHLPTSFEEEGHSSAVIANRIHYRIQQIIQRVSATEKIKGYSTADAEKEVSVDVAGMGLPIKGFVELLGGALGIQRSKKIDIDFFVERGSLVMLLKISGNAAERFEVPMSDSIDTALKALVLEAAETILKYSNDEILQTYFGLVEQIGDKQIKLAKYRLEKYRNDPKTEVNAIAALAWGLCMLKKHDEAEVIIKEGLARHKKKAGRIYVIWGSLLMHTGEFEKALEKFNKALEQVSKNESITRVSNIYSSIGNCYTRLQRSEDALNYLQQAIKVDPNSSRAYFNLAMFYFSNKDSNQFIEFLEKALEKGFQRQNILKDSRYSAMIEDPRMLKLMENYAAE